MNDVIVVRSHRGTKILVVDGYRYYIRRDRCTVFETFWKCIGVRESKKRCCMSIKTNHEHTVIRYKSPGIHDHPLPSKCKNYGVIETTVQDLSATEEAPRPGNEENQVSCSSPIPSSPTRTKDVTKQYESDSTASWATERINIAAEAMAYQRTFDGTKSKAPIPSNSVDSWKIPEQFVACRSCGLLFKNLNSLAHHQSTKHERNPMNTHNNSINNWKLPEQFVACQTCGLLFKNFNFLAQHQSSVHKSTAVAENRMSDQSRNPKNTHKFFV